MGNIHRTTLSLIRKLRSLRPVHVSALESFHVPDNSMAPALVKGDVVQYDTGEPVTKGAIVAIAVEDSVVFRELQIFDGEFYLVAQHEGFPTVSMRDFRVLNPGAFFCGVVC